MTSMIAWVFMPTKTDMNKPWNFPPNYVPAQIGEVRFRLPTDTAMSDETIYQPGWKRVATLDQTIQ